MRTFDQKRDLEKLQHIFEAIEGINQLLESGLRNDIGEKALERYFEIIGEACRGVSENIRNKYPEIPWANIISLRNFISHEYDKVKIETLWDIAQHKIPALKDWIKGILEEQN